MTRPIDCSKLAGALLVTTLAVAGLAQAQEPTVPPQDAKSKRQARIEAYLQKKEQKRLVKQQEKAERDATRAAEAEAQAQAAAAAAAAELEREQVEEAARLQREDEKEAERAVREAASGRSEVPKSLRIAQQNVRRSKLGQDPTVQTYLDLVDRREASPYQLAALGNFIAEAGMRADAMEYYRVALSLEKDDPLLWMNAGTLYRQGGDPKAAINAYVKALGIDRYSAEAHYNLGAAFDEMGKYDEAVIEYKIALTLDPALGDPAVNPQAANNDRLMAVRLLLYKEAIGSAGLPLADIPGGGLPDSSGGND